MMALTDARSLFPPDKQLQDCAISNIAHLPLVRARSLMLDHESMAASPKVSRSFNGFPGCIAPSLLEENQFHAHWFSGPATVASRDVRMTVDMAATIVLREICVLPKGKG